MAQLTVRFRGATRMMRSDQGLLEFGRDTQTGLIVLTRSKELRDYVHAVCGWFGWAEGWYVERRAGTSNIDLTMTKEDEVRIVADGKREWLGTGSGVLVIDVYGMRGLRETVRLEWSVPGQEPRAPRPRQPGVTTLGTRTAVRDEAALADPVAPTIDVPLSQTERDVMAAYAAPLLAGDTNWASLTSGDVARRLFRGDARGSAKVNKAVDRAKRKVQDAQALLGQSVFEDRPGVKGSAALATWLVANGVITDADIDRLPPPP